MPDSPIILLVEDDRHVVDMLDGLLRTNGYRTLFATDGEQALKLLARETVSLVLLDLMLPKLDGYAVLESIRKNPKTKALPVIILSARDIVSDVEKAFGKGANDYLIKPLHTDRLLAKIRKHIAPGPAH